MVVVVQSLWNQSITQKLVEGATQRLEEKKIDYEVIKVPGALEIPLAIKWAWSKGQRTQKSLTAAIACGCVIKGETQHFDIVANESARALMDLSVDLRLPIGNAVLCVFDPDQAKTRSEGEFNKGIEAADSVLQMSRLKEKMEY